MARVGKCYVCGKSTKPKERKINVSPVLWRHNGCCTGSPKWLESKRAKESQFRWLFKTKENGE